MKASRRVVNMPVARTQFKHFFFVQKLSVAVPTIIYSTTNKPNSFCLYSVFAENFANN